MKHPEEIRAELEKQIGEIYPESRAFLKRRYPNLRQLHEDLIQQTSRDVLELISRPQPKQIENLPRFFFGVLKHRIADHFRSPARRWADELLLEDLPTEDPNTDPERIAHCTLLLKRVVGLITQLNADDRLFLLESSSAEAGTALTDAQRKRLSRIRARLRKKLED